MAPSKTLWIVFVGIVAFACTPKKGKNSKLDYYGADSQEADFAFRASVEFSSPRNLSATEIRLAASEAINLQVKHLFGTLKEHAGSEADGVINFKDSPGVPKASHKIVLGTAEIKSQEPGRIVYSVPYDFKDKAAFHKDFFKTGEKLLKIRLPKNPETIYAQGLVDGKNKCTDDHYNSEGDFWYFWDPYMEGCPAVVMENTLLIESRMIPKANTELTFPEYERMLEDGVLDITYVVGPDHDKSQADDLGRQAFEKTFTILTKGRQSRSSNSLSQGTRSFLGSIPEKDDLIFKVLDQSSDSRTVYAFKDGKKIVIQMFFVDLNSESFFFSSIVRDAIMSADVFLYDGHSGLGGNLPISRFFFKGEKKFALDKYQILFFNGCSTFAYYNEEYFAQKITAKDPAGSKNLDIITTSIGAPWSTGAEVDSIFLLSLANGTRPSWQKIMDDVYYVDDRDSALTQVNGDEDNPRTAR